MYAVIFRARIRALDDRYQETAARLRSRAMTRYNCRRFEAVTEGRDEITISWWDSLDDIHAWKRDSEHRAAQSLGREKWYDRYEVQVARIEESYGFGA